MLPKGLLSPLEKGDWKCYRGDLGILTPMKNFSSMQSEPATRIPGRLRIKKIFYVPAIYTKLKTIEVRYLLRAYHEVAEPAPATSSLCPCKSTKAGTWRGTKEIIRSDSSGPVQHEAVFPGLRQRGAWENTHRDHATVRKEMASPLSVEVGIRYTLGHDPWEELLRDNWSSHTRVTLWSQETM